MMERMREGASSIWVKIILGLIIFSFVFAGVGVLIGRSLFRFRQFNGDVSTTGRLGFVRSGGRCRSLFFFLL